MASTSKPRARWVKNIDPHTPGALLKRGRAVIGRVLYSDMTRSYSCFLGSPEAERWLGVAGDLAAAKDKVDHARAVDVATEFLRGISPGQRVSLFDPRAVNFPGQWCAVHMLEEAPDRLPYTPVCTKPMHFKIYMRTHLEIPGFVSNLCACELAKGSKHLAVWEMPADAKHVMSATGFDNGKHDEERQTWQSTMCGVLWETTGGRSWHKDGHMSYPAPVHWPKITCPGCAMREGRPPAEIDGVTVFEVSA